MLISNSLDIGIADTYTVKTELSAVEVQVIQDKNNSFISYQMSFYLVII